MANRPAKSKPITLPRQKRPAAKDRYQPGMIIGPFTLLDVAVWDRNIHKRKWWVVYNCCGREAIRSYCTISNGSAGIRTPGRCIDCERQARGASGVLRRTPLSPRRSPPSKGLRDCSRHIQVAPGLAPRHWQGARLGRGRIITAKPSINRIWFSINNETYQAFLFPL